MPRRKAFLALLFLFLGAVVALVFLPRGRNPADDATTAKSIALYGYDDDGDPLWQIRARDGRIEGSDQTLSDVAIDFHNEDGSTMSVRGDRLERTEAISHLSGDVRLERTDDLLLRTEALTWDEADERLESGPIDLSTADLHVSAAGFGYDLETATASFTGGVEATASLETDWTIRAERAEERDGVVSFLDGVTVDSEEGHVRAESVRLDGNGILATGGVEARLDLKGLREPDGT